GRDFQASTVRRAPVPRTRPHLASSPPRHPCLAPHALPSPLPSRLVCGYGDAVGRSKAKRDRRARRRQWPLRAAGGLADSDRQAVGQRHIKKGAFPLVDALLDLAGEHVEMSTLRRIDHFELFRPDDQVLSGSGMARWLSQVNGPFSQIGRTIADLDGKKM